MERRAWTHLERGKRAREEDSPSDLMSREDEGPIDSGRLLIAKPQLVSDPSLAIHRQAKSMAPMAQAHRARDFIQMPGDSY